MLPPISRHYLLFVFPTGGLEEKIKKYEDRLNELDEVIADETVATNSAKLNEISQEQNEISEKLDDLMQEWEVLSDQL